MQNNFSKCREWVPRGTSQHKWRWLTTLLLILTLGIGQMWGQNVTLADINYTQWDGTAMPSNSGLSNSNTYYASNGTSRVASLVGKGCKLDDSKNTPTATGVSGSYEHYLRFGSSGNYLNITASNDLVKNAGETSYGKIRFLVSSQKNKTTDELAEITIGETSLGKIYAFTSTSTCDWVEFDIPATVSKNATITLTRTSNTLFVWGIQIKTFSSGPVDPTINTTNGAYTINGTALDLTTCVSSNNTTGAFSFAVKTDGDTDASIDGSSFTANYEGTCVVTATQAAVSGTWNQKSVDFNVVVSAAAGKTDPTATFSNSDYTIGGDLDLSTLFTSNSEGSVTYTITDAGETSATLASDGKTFSASAVGTATVQASQAATSTHNAVVKTATITVKAAAPAVDCSSIMGTIYKFETKSSGLGTGAVCALKNTDYAMTTSNSLKALQGGTLTARASSDNSGNLAYNNNSFKFTGGSAGWLILNLECEIKEGDIIRYIKTNSGNISVRHTSNTTTTNAFNLTGNSANVQTIAIPSAFVGKSTIYLTRGSNTAEISYFEIVRPYIVTLAAGEGATVTPTSISASANEVVALPHPVKDGSLFTGWYEGETKVSDAYTVTKNVTLTAHYSDCPETGSVYKFEVKTGLANGACVETNTFDVTKVNYLSALDGGTLSAYNNNSKLLIANNNSFQMTDNSKSYLKVDLDCALEVGDYFKTTVAGNTMAITIANSQSTDYTVTVGTEQVKEIPAAWAGKKTLYLWRGGGNASVSYFEIVRPEKVTVTFNSDGGSTVDAATIVKGAKVTAPTAPTKDNYSFVHWYKVTGETGEEDVAYDFDDAVNADMTLKAKWAAYPTLTLNRGTAPSGYDVTTQYAPGATVEVPACPFSYTGYNFDGWNYSKVVTMVDETHFTMPNEDLTLTAQWVNANFVARIGSNYYATLAEALAHAAEGEIVLLQDINVEAQVEIADGVSATIDLAGHKIEYTGATTLTSGVIMVHNGASLTINDSSDPDAGSIVSGDNAYAAIALTKAGDNAANPAVLVINGGTLTGYYYGITGNGSRPNTQITINGGAINATATNDNLGIYHPQNGTLTVTDGTITGYASAIEMRAGTLVIEGGTFTATATEFSCNPNGSGTTTVGAAIAIAQHTTKKDIEVTINGGTFNGVKALNESNPQANDPAPQVTMAVTAGTFTGEVSTVDVDKFVSGGSFSEPVAEANCATDYYPATKPNGKYGVTVAALSVNFAEEAAKTEGQKTWTTFLTDNHYDYNLGDGGEISWDKTNAYDTGLKLKKSTNNAIYFTTEPGKLIELTVGNIAGMTIQINGGAAQTITGGANNDDLGVSYYYSDNAQAVVLKETSGNSGYNMLKSINIRDPYTVSFDANGGDAVASLKATPAINLPSATNGTQNFAGWYDALDNLIGNAGDPYTPTANITLVAHWEAISTDNTLSDLKVGGETVDGFSPSVHTYYVVLPYGTKPENIPAITATANSAKAKQVAIQQAVWTGEPYNCYRAQANVQAEDNSWGYYDVRFSFAPKDMACLIKATVTGDNAMAIDASASMFEGTPDIYKVYGNAETYESKSAPKFQGDGYLGVTLTTAGAAFQEGDVVRVFATKGIDNVAKLYVYSDNTGTAAKQIAESETALVKGYNEAALTAAGEGATSVFLCRAGQYTSWNPCIYDIAVYRAVPKPVLSAITIGGATENAVNQSTKTISLEISAVAAADLANLSVTPTFMSNDPSQTTGAVTSNEGAWVLGANTYLVTDKDGDTETYTINLSAAAGIKEVVISGTLAVLEDETTTLSAVVYDTNDEVAAIQDVTWSVKAGDEALASVTSAGVVTGKAVGTAHIIATSVADNTKSAEVAVVVSENPCRAWSNPSSKETGATIGKMVVTPTGIGTLQENMTPYQGASATNAWKLDSKDSRYAEIKFTDNAQFESLLLGVSSKDNDKNYKFAVVCSSAAGDGFAAGVLSATTYEAVDQDEAENLVDVELPVGTKAVRVYRQYTNDYGGDKSVFLYYINACKKELVALTSIAVADKTLAVGVAGTPAVTLTPANADVASYVWEIENDGTGAAVISAKGVISSTATGVVTVKVTATDALNNVVASNVATVNIVNKFVDVAPVTETTNWNWSGIASENTVISDVDTVLANYYSGSQWERIAGKAANDQYAYRAEGHDCYQGTYLFFKTTVPGMLTINSRYASSGAKIEVNGNEIATLTGSYENYSVAVPAGDVKIVATGGQKMRIKTMTFDTDLAAYELTDNALNGYTRPVTEGKYGTICLPNGGVMVGASIYTLAYYGETSKKIFFDEVVDGTMEAGKPYLFLPNEGIDRIGVFYTDAANEPNKTVNGFVGYIGASEDPNDALQVPAGEGNYIVQNNQYREILTGATAYILSHRAYIHFAGINTSEPAKAPGARRIGISGAPQVVTGVDGLNVGDQPVKLIIDGQMYILRGDKMYDATGRLVK
ncbi:MAG: InlB B-repeat-containing protein [Paludibacteraceae bacterium]|nr:InlB B-repeat-containing protein [Paludibacteraceae bacterium]